MGVPVIGCACAVCRSADVRDNRTRASVVVRGGGRTLLVDTGPDLRAQALRENLREIDAVIYTHGHLDHVAGFDELRAFCWRREEKLPLHATAGCMAILHAMYGWAFAEESRKEGYVWPEARLIEGPFAYGELVVTPLPVEHGSVETVGFLFQCGSGKRLAYLPDVKRIPEATMSLLENVDVLVVDALRTVPHGTHFSLEEALAAAAAMRAGETWLTHLTHEYEYAVWEGKLPPGVRLAWDGLRISL